MTRLLAVLAAALVAVGVFAGGAAASAQERSPRVVIVSLPAVTWDDIESLRPPAITEVVEHSAVASLSLRTIGPTTTLAEAYATIGAGNRAPSATGGGGFVFDRAAMVEGSPAADVYERRTGLPAEGDVLHLGIAEVQRLAHRQRYGAEPGSLGEALEDAGMSAAVVADTDLGDPAVAGPNRPAALAVMDRDGQVAGGVVGGPLATHDDGAPFAVRLDLVAVNAAVESLLTEHEVVLVEASDLARADAYGSRSTPRGERRNRAEALAAADQIVADVVEELDPAKDLLLLVAPTAPGEEARLTVFAARGPGFEPGLAQSATTRRPGYVTLPDIAPTVLEFLDVEQPDSMTGTVITAAPGEPDVDLGDLAAADEIARFRDEAVGPASVAFIVFQVVVYAMAAVAVATRRPWLRPVTRATALVVLGIPTVGFLSGAVRYDEWGMAPYIAALFAGAAVLAGGVWAVSRRHPYAPPLLLAGIALAVQIVDVATGSRLQIDTPFGYSPIVAGRFSGFGNLAFGLAAMSALVFATGLWALARPRGSARPPAPRSVVIGAALVLGITVVADGLPAWGSDVGGVLATVPSYAVALALLIGWRITWPRFIALGAAGVAVVGLFAAIDLARPADERTHLGRFVQRLGDGDAGDIIARKIQANINILTSSIWTWLIPFALAFLAFLTWRGRDPLRRLQRDVPGLRACLVSAIALGALGMAVNDSGVAVPAMMFGVLLPWVTWLVVASPPDETAAVPSAVEADRPA